jgi:solute carrier family 25 (mitochondrial carnitine/acylcarnitine transporter), member 20/29
MSTSGKDSRQPASGAGAVASKINKRVDASLPPAAAHAVPHIPETKAEAVADVKAAASAGAAQLRSLAGGGFGGVCAVVVGHPFDLVKVRMQTADRGVYSGALDVLRKGIARDGLRRGLYAGVSAPLVGVTPMCKSPPHLATAPTHD